MIFSTCLVALSLALPLQQSSRDLPAAPQVGTERRAVDPVEEEYIVELDVYEISDLAAALCPEMPDIKEDPDVAALRKMDLMQESAVLLGSTLRTYMKPVWKEKANAMEIIGGRNMLMTGTEEQHAWVNRFLQNLRDKPDQMMFGTVRYIEVPRGQLKKYGLEFATTLLEEKQVEDLLRKAMASEDVDILSGPRVLVRPICEATVSVLEEIAYIKTYEIRMIEPDKVLLADPVVDTVAEGYVLKLACTPLPDGLYGTAIDFNRSSIQRPIPTREIRLATEPESKGTISSPAVTRISVSSTVLLEDGQSVAFTTPANDDEKDLIVIVHVKSVERTGIEVPQPDRR